MSAISVYFLSADTPLTKSFALSANNEIQKTSYPNVKNFTSHKVPVASLSDLHRALLVHSKAGHCLIKGALNRELKDESRAASTGSDDKTSWLCLDLDGAPYNSPKEFMQSVPVLKDVAYIVQYSASYGVMGDTSKLSCHIFILIDGSIPAPMLKAWLMELNLTHTTTEKHKGLREAITLTRTGGALHWPVDITACQNDKLLYIAPPNMGKGVTCTLKPTERIQLIPGKQQTITAKALLPGKSLERLKEEERATKNALRKAAGLAPLRSNTKWVGEYEVQAKPGEAVITEQRIDRGFVYFNLNGGDSWAYYHPEDNYELIHNFKGEPVYYTKELLPGYYKERKAQDKRDQTLPGTTGLSVLAFRDKRTAKYMNGTWDEATQTLELHPAKSELQLNHWMMNHGKAPFDVIPVWDVHFDPQSIVIIDDENRRINSYVPTPYFRQEFTKGATLEDAPLIARIIKHAVSLGETDETLEHFLNWLAVIFQKRVKPKTAWILHGTEGTGKGVLVNRILAPLLGDNYVIRKRASELEEKYTGWLETALIAFIDEIEVAASTRKDTISGDLRNFITEDMVTIRHMNQAALQVANYTGFIFASNKAQPVEIASNDRRYNVGLFQPQQLQINDEEIKHINTELSRFMNYIMTREADVNKAAKCLKNAAHDDIVLTNRTSAEVTAMQIQNGEIMELWGNRADDNLNAQIYGERGAVASAYRDIIKREIKLVHEKAYVPPKRNMGAKFASKDGEILSIESRLKRDELFVIFEHCVGNMPKSPNKFSSLLRHKNLKTEQIRFEGERAYGLHVEWKCTTNWLLEQIEMFNRQEGVTKLKRVK